MFWLFQLIPCPLKRHIFLPLLSQSIDPRRFMKLLCLCVTSLIIASCTHGKSMVDIEKRIQTVEKKEYEEIQNDLQLVIERHPELSSSQREKLKSQVLEGLDRHRLLKEQERQVIGLFLHSHLDPAEKDEVRKAFKEKLEDIYQAKARNIEEVVENVATPLRNNPPTPIFEDDFKTLMREFR